MTTWQKTTAATLVYTCKRCGDSYTELLPGRENISQSRSDSETYTLDGEKTISIEATQT